MLPNMCSSGLQPKLLYVKYGDAISDGTNADATANANAYAVSNADANAEANANAYAVSSATTDANTTTATMHHIWLLHGSSTSNYTMDANVLPSHLQTGVWFSMPTSLLWSCDIPTNHGESMPPDLCPTVCTTMLLLLLWTTNARDASTVPSNSTRPTCLWYWHRIDFAVGAIWLKTIIAGIIYINIFFAKLTAIEF